MTRAVHFRRFIELLIDGGNIGQMNNGSPADFFPQSRSQNKPDKQRLYRQISNPLRGSQSHPDIVDNAVSAE